jgi:GTPase
MARTKRSVVAIVGRPNVGKSTLFNRLLGRRRAIVEDTPGVTRDRHFADAMIYDRPVTLVDTGGFVPDSKEEPLAKDIRLQAQAAVEESDVVIFVVDGRAGLTNEDADVARYLRKQKIPVILAVNKCENHRTSDLLVSAFHRTGLGEPFPVAAEHNEGMEALREEVVKHLPAADPNAVVKEKPRGRRARFVEREVPKEQPDADKLIDEVVTDEEGQSVSVEAEVEEDEPIRIALVGRPNVGKSTLVNALLKEDRVIVSPIAGTTRDPIDSEFTFKGKKIILTDTAGIRRKSVISQRVEHFSVFGALRAVEDSHVSVLVIDATQPHVEQDMKIASLAAEKGRALIICVNKWDLISDKREEEFREEMKWYMNFVSWAPMIFVSAKEGKKVDKIPEIAIQLIEQLYFKASTPMLNRIVEHVTSEHSLPVIDGRQLRIYYSAQVAKAPPGFSFICNTGGKIPDRYQRYVSNYLRETFRLKVPIRLYWRERPGQKRRAEVAQRFKARQASKAKKHEK